MATSNPEAVLAHFHNATFLLLLKLNSDGSETYFCCGEYANYNKIVCMY